MPTDNERALNSIIIKRSFAYNPLIGEAYRKACLEYHGEFACHD